MTARVDIDPEDGSKIIIHSDYAQRELIKEIPGSSWERERGVWRIPLGWSGCLALRSSFGADLVIGPRLNEWARNERDTRINPAMVTRENLSALGDADLYPHQRADVLFLRFARAALLGNAPGTGKTASAIRTLMHAYAGGETVFPVLVVCPNSVKHTWRREIAKWWPGCTVQVVSGTALQRRKQLATDAHFYIINWEALRTHSRLAPYGSIALKRCRDCGGHDDAVTEGRCEVHTRELNLTSFGAIIADEAHRMKDPKSKMSRALWSLSEGTERRIAMTGTPIANDVSDLWSILHWLSPSEWPGKSKWLNRNCNVYFDAWGGMVISGIKPERQEEFDAAFLPRFRRVQKSAVLTDLPPVVTERRDVPMSPKQRKAYETMRDDLVAEVDGGLLVAGSVLTRTGRLAQLASAYGEMVRDDEKDTERFVLGDPSSKVDAFMDDITDFGDQSVVVMAVSKQLINLLSSRMTAAKIPHGLITGDQNEYERDVAVEDFQAGKTKFILCTIQAGGVGLTLTAGSIMAFLQRSWSLIDMEQAKNRCHRPGAEKHESILILDYVAPGTIEEAIIDALSGKGEQLENVVRDKEALRKMLMSGEE